MKNSLIFTQHFKVRLSPHKGTSAPGRAVPAAGPPLSRTPQRTAPHRGFLPRHTSAGRPRRRWPDPVPRRRGETAPRGPPTPPGSSHLATWRLPAARPRRRRLPVVAGQAAAGSKRRPRRPHRGAVTMGRTPSPAPSGSHRRRGGGRRGGRRRHLERGARPGSRRPPC